MPSFDDDAAQKTVTELDVPSSETPKRVAAYWQSKCSIDEIPFRGDIDPVDMARDLPRVFLVEVIGGGTDFFYRLAGEEVCQLHRQPLRGKRVEDILSPEVSTIVRDQYRGVVAVRRPNFSTFRVWTKDYRLWNYERALLPLRGSAGGVEVLLGAIGTPGAGGAAARVI